jgi:mannosyltransferase
MTASRELAVVPPPGRRAVPPGSGRPAGLGAPWVAVIPGLITLAVTLYRVQAPSFTRDEGATLLAVHRSFPQLVRMLGNVDVVHGEYYALIWAVTRVAASSALAVRFPSAAAMAVTAGAVTLLGQRLVSGRAGLAAGLVTAALPPVSYFAEDAREYAMEAGLAAVASYLLIRALGAGRSRRGWMACYAAALAALGLGNLFSLLIIPAHAVVLYSQRRRGLVGRDVIRSFLAAAAVAVGVVIPVAVTAAAQLHQFQWIKRPGIVAVISLAGLVGRLPLFFAAVGVIVAAVAVGALGGRSRLARGWPPDLAALAVPWALLPPALLLGVSFIHPVFVFRYLVFCIPAAALLTGTALAALGRVAGIAAFALLVFLGVPAQAAERGPVGHGYDIRAADHIVARHERPGDALLNVRYWPAKWGGGIERGLESEYSSGLSQLHDISQGLAPASSASLGGTFAPASTVRHRVAGVTRLWVASWGGGPVSFPGQAQFTLAHRWHVRGVWLWLYIRVIPRHGQVK